MRLKGGYFDGQTIQPSTRPHRRRNWRTHLGILGIQGGMNMSNELKKHNQALVQYLLGYDTENHFTELLRDALNEPDYSSWSGWCASTSSTSYPYLEHSSSSSSILFCLPSISASVVSYFTRSSISLCFILMPPCIPKIPKWVPQFLRQWGRVSVRIVWPSK